MAYDEIFVLRDDNDVELIVNLVPLNLDNKMYLLQVFEEDFEEKKKYIRNQLVLVANHLLTSRFSDTVHFMEEIKLFDYGNDQNKYLDIREYKSTKNLKLKYSGDENIFISKSEASAMVKLFNLSFKGRSEVTLLDNEFVFSPQMLAKTLQQNKLLEK